MDITIDNSISYLIYILRVIGMWFVLEKCGVDGWKAIIPFYDMWCLAKCASSDDRLANNYKITCFAVVGISMISAVYMFGAAFGTFGEVFSIEFFMLLLVPTLIFFGTWGMYLQYRISKGIALAFGKETSFGIGLWLFPFVFYPLLGFDKTIEYRGPQEY